MLTQVRFLSRHLRHVREWRLVLREEGALVTWRTWLKMLRGALGARVRRPQWIRRAKTCRRCPVFDSELRRCAGPFRSDGSRTGCGCYVIYKLSVRFPYGRDHPGCWGRVHIGSGFGWE